MSRLPRPVVPHATLPGVFAVHMRLGVALISELDVEAVREYVWHIRSKKEPYARTRTGGISRMSLHRLVANRMGLATGDIIDHVNGDRLDCRRENPRAATCAQNSWNAKLKRTNKSGIKGVCWSVQAKKWTVRVGVAPRRVFLGRYSTLTEAGAVASAARERLHGEFARHA